ncbi:MAG: hypothetical protein Ct9H90mP24_5760 [Methanobacteriota archaeon]|nr:MAG: hypothetical protein Ct9H90mP24_5760 [Euryarchaeota archaeon]
MGIFGRTIVALLPFAPRFVVGWVAKRVHGRREPEQALELMTKLSSEEACFTVDVLGEEINSIEESSWFIDEYERVLDSIVESGIDAKHLYQANSIGSTDRSKISLQKYRANSTQGIREWNFRKIGYGGQ